MSIYHLNQAFSAEIGKSSLKFILVALADYANEQGEAYPSVETVCNKTALNRKTVLAGLKELSLLGFIYDTKMRRGRTGQVKVWSLTFNKETENGMFKEVLKRNSTKNGTVPKSSSKHPESGGLKAYQKRDIEPSVSLTIKKPSGVTHPRTPNEFIKPTLEQVHEYCKERKNGINPKRFHAYYESNGWKTGRHNMKDWKASIRYWEQDNGGNHAANKSSHTTSSKPSAAQQRASDYIDRLRQA